MKNKIMKKGLNSFATHLGVAIPEGACLDSFDVMPALLGKEGAKGRDNLIQQDNGNAGTLSSFGYRSSNWKLQRKNAFDRKTRIANEDPAKMQYTLYDLDVDPAEKNNVAKQHPEVFERMKAELQKLLDDGRSRH